MSRGEDCYYKLSSHKSKMATQEQRGGHLKEHIAHSIRGVGWAYYMLELCTKIMPTISILKLTV